MPGWSLGDLSLVSQKWAFATALAGRVELQSGVLVFV